MTPRESYQRLRPDRGSAEAKTRQPDITNKQPAIGSRRSRGLSRSVVMFRMGIAARIGLAVLRQYGDRVDCKLHPAPRLVGAASRSPGAGRSRDGCAECSKL